MKALRLFILTAVVLLMSRPISAQNVITFPLSAWTTGIVNMWDGTPLEFYGFSRGLTFPILPGPTITCNEGDTVIINMRNRSQGAHHTIHLHGLDVDQVNDGVPHTSFSVAHGDDSAYTFVAKHAGTYFYHCHVLSIWHVQLGMYGSIIVNAAGNANTVWTGGPSFDREFNWLSSEIDKNWFDSIPVQHANDSTFETIPVLRYLPEYYLVNGKSRQVLDTTRSARILANTGEKVHLRIGNMGYYANRIQFPVALNAQIVASDGRPLPTVLDQDSLWVFPGERYSILLDMAGPTQDSIQIAWSDMFTGQQREVDHIPVIHGVGIGFEESTATELEIGVYPQPADAWALLSLPEIKQSGDYQVLDMNGHSLLSGSVKAGQTMLSLPVAKLPSGMYQFRMQSGSKTGQTRVLVMH